MGDRISRSVTGTGGSLSVGFTTFPTSRLVTATRFFLFMVRDTVSAQGVSRAMDTPFVSKTGCVVAGASKRSGHSCRDCRASCRSVLFEWFSLQSRCIGDTGSRDEVSPAFWYPIGIARCLTLLLGFLSGGDGRIGVGLAFWLPILL